MSEKDTGTFGEISSKVAILNNTRYACNDSEVKIKTRFLELNGTFFQKFSNNTVCFWGRFVSPAESGLLMQRASCPQERCSNR